MSLNGTYDEYEKVNVLTTIFGENEDVDLRSSAIPWLFDEWFHGDFKDQWEGTLSRDRSTKELEEYVSDFPDFRIDSAIEIGFDTDGQTVTDYEVQMTDPDNQDSPAEGSVAPITLEGGADEPSNPFRNQLDYYDDGEGQKLPATVKGPYTDVDDTFTVKGVEGVRASIILGGSDQYLKKLKKDLFSLADLVPVSIPTHIIRYMAHVATFYSFIDFAFMADGTRVVRVWDASLYPAQALYVAGILRDKNKFREGIEWVKQGHAWEHEAFMKFGLDAQNPEATPFDQGGSFLYESLSSDTGFRSGWGNHPVMEFIDGGTTLIGTESKFQEPLYPDFDIF